MMQVLHQIYHSLAQHIFFRTSFSSTLSTHRHLKRCIIGMTTVLQFYSLGVCHEWLVYMTSRVYGCSSICFFSWNCDVYIRAWICQLIIRESDVPSQVFIGPEFICLYVCSLPGAGICLRGSIFTWAIIAFNPDRQRVGKHSGIFITRSRYCLANYRTNFIWLILYILYSSCM